MPFSVVGSNTLLEVNGKRVRGRLYPWGVVEVENKDHCDFVKLRNMLIRQVMADQLVNIGLERWTSRHSCSVDRLAWSCCCVGLVSILWGSASVGLVSILWGSARVGLVSIMWDSASVCYSPNAATLVVLESCRCFKLALAIYTGLTCKI